MSSSLDRRSFLKLAGAAALGSAFKPVPPILSRAGLGLARTAIDGIGLYPEPSFRSGVQIRLDRDQLLGLEERVTTDEGPVHNPTWFRIADGFVHSGNLQLVRWEPQAPQTQIPVGGALFEITVPYTRSYEHADPTSAARYRLYYESTAWVEAVEVGTDHRAWYRIVDDRLRVRYYARAEHLRRISDEELSPLSPDVPAQEKSIRVWLAQQELTAWEGDQLVLRTRISSGIPDSRPRDNGLPTITPTGRFFIERKMPRVHMGDGYLTSAIDAYELPGVPWVAYFTATGVAFHGTYWHTDFGRPRSHGCINMRTEEARWLYRWSTPEIPPSETYRLARGTVVHVS
ncbi:MAG: L,D-transpeptidase [Anaerolineales bacterium]